MTSFREILADLIREYFAIPRSTHDVQIEAASWQRSPLPHNLALLPGYRPGQYARTYHTQLVSAIRTATTPHFEHIATTPLAARDIQYASTPPIEDDDVTEMRPAIKRKPLATSTQEIPAINAEIMLMEMMRGPAHAQSTGEHEQLKEPML